MIPEDLPPMQARTPQELVPLQAAIPWLDPEEGPDEHTRVFPDGPACCPTCGRPDVCFSLRASGVLDALHLARDVISDAIALVEEAVLP